MKSRRCCGDARCAVARTVAAAAASVWAFALRNGTPEFRRRQVDVLLILIARGGGGRAPG
jgi:hypothetical protein